MSWISGPVVFVLIWWILLFAILPIGVRSQEEDQLVVPGSVSSAPTRPMIWRKMGATTAIAITLWLGLFFTMRNPPAGLIDFLGWFKTPAWIPPPKG